MSTSEPLAQVDERVEWMLVIHDWNKVGQWMDQDSLSEISIQVRSDMEQWKNWSAEYPEVQRWLMEQPTYIFWGKGISNKVIWSWGLPDKWSDDDLAKIQAYIPHLEVKDDVLYWSMDGEALAGWKSSNEELSAIWRNGYGQMDEEKAVSWMSIQGGGWICVDFDRYQWVGLMSADSTREWKTGWPVDTVSSKWVGANARHAWMEQVPEWQLDSATRAKFKVFSMDTLCDCDTWEAWTTWQSKLWTFVQYDSGWVAMQKTAIRPWKWLAPLLKDTTAQVKRFLAPNLMPPIHSHAGPDGWRLAENWNSGILLATDSATLKAYHADTSSFSALNFPVAGGRRIYREMWNEGEGDLKYSPVQVRHWLMGKAKGEMNIFLADEPSKWIVQLRAIK